MAISIKFSLDKDILIVYCDGTYTLESAKSTFLELVHVLKISPTKKVLIDCRNLFYLNNSIYDSYHYAITVKEELYKHKLFPKLAYLHSPKNKNDILQFSETVGVNRGININIFYNYKESLEWLKKN